MNGKSWFKKECGTFKSTSINTIAYQKSKILIHFIRMLIDAVEM